MIPRPATAAPAIRMPPSMKRLGPKRSMSHPARNPNSGPTISLLIALPEVTIVRDHPNSRTMWS